MSGIEESHSGPAEQVSGVATAARAIEGFLDEGREKNPAQGRKGAAEAPAGGEAVEQFGGKWDDGPGQPQTRTEEPLPAAEGQETRNEGQPETDDNDDSPLYAVTVQGEERLVPLEDLTKGYMLQADYTKKTQHLAMERQQFAEHAQAVAIERQQYAKLLVALEQQLTGGSEVEPNWTELSIKDPVGYVRTKAAWDEKQQVLAAARSERERVENLQRQEYQGQYAQYIQGQQQAILRVKPDLADPAKAKAYRDELVAYGTNVYGYGENELNAITDHRMALILEKAMLYDRATQKGGQVQQQFTGKGKRTRQVIRPGAAHSTQVTGNRSSRLARDRLSKTGDVRDAASLFEKLL